MEEEERKHEKKGDRKRKYKGQEREKKIASVNPQPYLHISNGVQRSQLNHLVTTPQLVVIKLLVLDMRSSAQGL